MTTIRLETLPTSWDDARDTPYFRIIARLFSAEFCLGASVLLASNDDAAFTTDQPASVPSDANAGTSAPTTADSRPGSDLIPVRVRRAPLS